MVHTKIYIVATVIFIGETFSVVNAAVFELAVTFGNCIGQPAGCFSQRFLCKYFQSDVASAVRRIAARAVGLGADDVAEREAGLYRQSFRPAEKVAVFQL